MSAVEIIRILGNKYDFPGLRFRASAATRDEIVRDFGRAGWRKVVEEVLQAMEKARVGGVPLDVDFNSELEIGVAMSWQLTLLLLLTATEAPTDPRRAIHTLTIKGTEKPEIAPRTYDPRRRWDPPPEPSKEVRQQNEGEEG